MDTDKKRELRSQAKMLVLNKTAIEDYKQQIFYLNRNISDLKAKNREIEQELDKHAQSGRALNVLVSTEETGNWMVEVPPSGCGAIATAKKLDATLVN